jgi:hypothetical protein
VYRGHEHKRNGGKLLGREAGLVAEEPARRYLHVLSVATPPVGPGRVIAWSFVLGRDLPFGRIGRKPGSHDHSLPDPEIRYGLADLRDLADDVRADDMRQRDGPADGA